MELNSLSDEELVHLVKFGISSDRRQLTQLVRKVAKRVRNDNRSLSQRLIEELAIPKEPESRPGSLRRASAPKSVDFESEEMFLRRAPSVAQEPTLSAITQAKITQIVVEQQRRDELESKGLAPDRTILFTGPPGVGKTLTAAWLADQLKRPLCILNLATIVGSRLGETGANLHAALSIARSSESVVLVDEIDALAKSRSDKDDIGEMKRVVTVLLQELDQWPTGGVLIGATNHSELLDRALWRRFDLKIEFMKADVDTAHKLLKQKFKDLIGAKYYELLSIAFDGEAFSTIAAFANRVQKRSVIEAEPIEMSIENILPEYFEQLRGPRKREFAVKLSELGFSQRKVSEITGVSRDTLRKMQSQ